MPRLYILREMGVFLAPPLARACRAFEEFKDFNEAALRILDLLKFLNPLKSSGFYPLFFAILRN